MTVRRRNLYDNPSVRRNVEVVVSEQVSKFMFICQSTRRILGYSTQSNVIEFGEDGAPLTKNQKIEV